MKMVPRPKKRRLVNPRVPNEFAVKKWGAGEFWGDSVSCCLNAYHHYQKGDVILRQADAVEGVVISRTTHYATVRFPDGVVEIEQFDPNYWNRSR